MKNIDEIVETTLATTKTPLTINAADLSDDIWTQATYCSNYKGKPMSEYNAYAKFLDSIKERDAKYDRLIKAALSFLYVKGYITKEEFENRESSRLNDIRTYERVDDGMFVVLFFDESEWNISVEVGSEPNIKSVIFNSGEENQVLYRESLGKPFHFIDTK